MCTSWSATPRRVSYRCVSLRSVVPPGFFGLFGSEAQIIMVYSGKSWDCQWNWMIIVVVWMFDTIFVMALTHIDTIARDPKLINSSILAVRRVRFSANSWRQSMSVQCLQFYQLIMSVDVNVNVNVTSCQSLLRSTARQCFPKRLCPMVCALWYGLTNPETR